MRVHIVQKGDTLWKIAKQYAVGFDELKRLNAHLANPDYIVPGMEIYLPAMSKEKEIVKERPVQQPAPAPVPAPKEQVKPVQQPTWQGDIYFQPQMPAQQMPMPMPMPQWQHTHVHVEPTIEQTMMMPQMPAPQMPMQVPQMMPTPMPMQPPMQPMYMPHCPPQMMPYPLPICMCCHGVQMDEYTMTSPMQREESSVMPKKCPDNDARVQQYYEEIQQITQQPSRCCTPPMHQHMMPMHHPMLPWHM